MFQTQTIIDLILTYRYFFLFPLACVEGPILALLIGFLVHLGYFAFIPAFLVLIFGDLIPDSIYFYIGRVGHNKKLIEKYRDRLKLVASSFGVVEKLWQNHPRKTMFFSKLAYGLSIPFLISAGLVKMTFEKFISYTIPATLFQYGVLMVVGYYLGKSYESAIKYVEGGYVIMAVIFVIILTIYILFMKYSKQQIEKMEGEDNNISIK